METNSAQHPTQPQSNKILIKGVITGALILIMLVPTLFIQNLVVERENRQKEVVHEVSSKWAMSQTISGPYFAVPYLDTITTDQGKIISTKKQLIILSNEMNADAMINAENRPRSIYKVLLYRTQINIQGMFKPQWPQDINLNNLDLSNAKICFGLSDFKGIEEEIVVQLGNQKIMLNPGLPCNMLNEIGLSAPYKLTFDDLNKGFDYHLELKLKGSEKLHFLPLAANSKFSMNSTIANPSFDGNSLPNERQITEKGFHAKWSFNHANLPFGTVFTGIHFQKENLSFGVSMVQPADQYNKTMRSVKYAILIIGLTFALFFIIELLQHKPFHPVQYVLVGMALVIFYTLLLSMSEYLLFDNAYLIEALATILLITLYAQSHFKKWRSALLFGIILSILYGFIFILIRLEDTALLVGSIGLFIVLAVIMYVSRSINWYGIKFNEV
jgi:inner membrane protein